MKHFHIFFWEKIKTNIGTWSGFIVEEASAAPILDNTERRGVDATHSGMIKFSDRSSSGYRTTIAASTRYRREAPKIIRNRWKVAREALGRARCNEAFELMGMAFDTYSGHNSADENDGPLRSRNKYFFPPQETATDFMGRYLRNFKDGFVPNSSWIITKPTKEICCSWNGGLRKDTNMLQVCKRQWRAVFE